MRIKDVCKATGLTDKTVRFYINNGLISPAYTENYAGRKNFSFSENDIMILNKIAVLRKYNFSVNDIKEMLSDNSSINEILEQHITKTKTTAEETSVILKNLLNASVDNVNSLDDLCEKLSSSPDCPDEVCEIDYMSSIKEFWQKFKRKLPLLILIFIISLTVTSAAYILMSILFANIFGNL